MGIVCPAGEAGAARGADPVVAAAGDIACDPASPWFNGGIGAREHCRQKYTSDLLMELVDTGRLGAVLTLGDHQYDDGDYWQFFSPGAYHSTWGRLKARTRPAIGNHEYHTAGAAGYCAYFGAAAHCNGRRKATRAAYYSFNIGAWHLISLNSNCSRAGGCRLGSPQETWLRRDLAANARTRCVLAYWHHPRFSSARYTDDPRYATWWTDLYRAGADIVLNGHDHVYERFARMAPSGARDPRRGVREFIVGTGGKSHTRFATVYRSSEVRDNTTFGVLKLTLRPASYRWEFLPEAGKTFTDSGTTRCR